MNFTEPQLKVIQAAIHLWLTEFEGRDDEDIPFGMTPNEAANATTAAVAMLADAARLVVAGQPLWWCEEHATISKSPRTQCWVAYDPDERDEADCRMVEGWWMRTGKDET